MPQLGLEIACYGIFIVIIIVIVIIVIIVIIIIIIIVIIIIYLMPVYAQSTAKGHSRAKRNVFQPQMKHNDWITAKYSFHR